MTAARHTSAPPADVDARITWHVDPDAPAGDVVGAMARLLIGVARRRRERAEAGRLADEQGRGGTDAT